MNVVERYVRNTKSDAEKTGLRNAGFYLDAANYVPRVMVVIDPEQEYALGDKTERTFEKALFH